MIFLVSVFFGSGVLRNLLTMLLLPLVEGGDIFRELPPEPELPVSSVSMNLLSLELELVLGLELEKVKELELELEWVPVKERVLEKEPR